MCDACAAEYADPRRPPLPRPAHRLPGVRAPALLPTRRGRRRRAPTRSWARSTPRWPAGEIVAIKGLGGYHLACDAVDDEAVARAPRAQGSGRQAVRPHGPRPRGGRPRSPSSSEAEAGGTSLAGPADRACAVAGRVRRSRPLVAPGNPLIGLMLPYTPLHHLLFAPVPGLRRPRPSVARAHLGQPQRRADLLRGRRRPERLAALADAFCIHDRPIEVPCDDSVVRVVDGAVLPIRRSRGFAPLPVRLPVPVAADDRLGWRARRRPSAWPRATTPGSASTSATSASLETEQALVDARLRPSAAMYGVDPERHAVDRHPGYRTPPALPRAAPGRGGARSSTTTPTWPRSWPSTASTARAGDRLRLRRHRLRQRRSRRDPDLGRRGPPRRLRRLRAGRAISHPCPCPAGTPPCATRAGSRWPTSPRSGSLTGGHDAGRAACDEHRARRRRPAGRPGHRLRADDQHGPALRRGGLAARDPPPGHLRGPGGHRARGGGQDGASSAARTRGFGLGDDGVLDPAPGPAGPAGRAWPTASRPTTWRCSFHHAVADAVLRLGPPAAASRRVASGRTERRRLPERPAHRPGPPGARRLRGSTCSPTASSRPTTAASRSGQAVVAGYRRS